MRKPRIKTLNGFLRVYKKLVKQKKGWYVDTYGGNQWIRYRDSSGCYCPLTYVCKELTGKKYGCGDFKLAAISIGLDENAAHTIADNADKKTYLPWYDEKLSNVLFSSAQPS